MSNDDNNVSAAIQAVYTLAAYLGIETTVGTGTGTSTGNAVSGSAGITASDNQHKTDVSGPEVLEGFNVLAQQQALNHQGNLNAVAVQAANTTQRMADLEATDAVFYSGLAKQRAIVHGHPDEHSNK